MSSAYPKIAAILAAGAFVACASPRTASTTITAADVSGPSSKEAPLPSASSEDLPASQLVCSTKSAAEGTTELFLEWNGAAAKGLLRRVAPSGMVTVTTVRAERHNGAIVADDTLSTDLVVHAATVREQNGKQYIRLGDWKQAWSACQ